MLSCKAGAECDPAVIVPGSDKTCGNIVAVPFFISFVFFVQFLMLNLFVAVIMDNFEFLTRDSSILGPQHLDKFPEAWSDLDPHATGFIPVMELKKLVSRLHPPLGMGDNAPERQGSTDRQSISQLFLVGPDRLVLEQSVLVRGSLLKDLFISGL